MRVYGECVAEAHRGRRWWLDGLLSGVGAAIGSGLSSFLERYGFSPQLGTVLIVVGAMAGGSAAEWLLKGRVHQTIRVRLGRHCVKCGYDLTGNVSGVCPECGEGVKERA